MTCLHLCAQEEITHCAAGVRWLSYLHGLANTTSVPASEGPSSASNEAGDVQGHAGSTPEWMAEARRHSSVETWFHELVQTHFRGSLKVPSHEFKKLRRHSAHQTLAVHNP